MATELIRCRNGKLAIQDTLMGDDFPIVCDKCDAEYRLRYSLAEINKPSGLENLRTKAKAVVNASHGAHLDSLSL
jgi:hypothetical protein